MWISFIPKHLWSFILNYTCITWFLYLIELIFWDVHCQRKWQILVRCFQLLSLWIKSWSVTIQMKPLWLYFSVVLFFFSEFCKVKFGNFVELIFYCSHKLWLQNSLLFSLFQEMLYVVPFVAKIIESSAKSKVFKPPNPWVMAIMAVLVELHQVPDLKVSDRTFL